MRAHETNFLELLVVTGITEEQVKARLTWVGGANRWSQAVSKFNSEQDMFDALGEADVYARPTVVKDEYYKCKYYGDMGGKGLRRSERITDEDGNMTNRKVAPEEGEKRK